MAYIQATTYPQNLFLAQDEDGRFHWYRKDPMKSDDLSKEEVSLEEALMAHYGYGTNINPIIVQIRGAKIDRATPFSLTFLEDFRLGRTEDHIEDIEGHVIEILSTRNSDGQYPLNGVVLSRNGEMIKQRTYSSTGECSDGVENHRLITVNGPAVFNNSKEINVEQ